MRSIRSVIREPDAANDLVSNSGDAFSVAMTAATHRVACESLLHGDGEEDLVFGLFRLSQGKTRRTALLFDFVFPNAGDRARHGNASFSGEYVERAAAIAKATGAGIALMHSHLGPGWQGMSDDDVLAERRWAPYAESVTGLPLVGITAGTDGAWSARSWHYCERAKRYQRVWAENVRVVGKRMSTTWCDRVIARPAFREMYKRTATVWGADNHASMARLRVGIVGLGSVGMLVAEMLARMGMTRLSFIDFDTILPSQSGPSAQLGATAADLDRAKIDVAEREALCCSSTARPNRSARKSLSSVVRTSGYKEALDCDVIFSCVDRPWPRATLNHIAYAHLIPVVDGGIAVRFRNGICTGADWQLQTVGPERACLDCLRVFDPADVGLEMEGKLDDPKYLQGLPADHRLKQNENVFPMSANLASLEILQFVALTTGVAGLDDLGVQRFRMMPGILDQQNRTCNARHATMRVSKPPADSVVSVQCCRSVRSRLRGR